MNNKLLLIIIVSIQNILIYSNSDEDFFIKAEKKFHQEQWTEALKNYENIQYKNSLVWQNIATCLFQEHKYAQALVALKRAQIKTNFKDLIKIDALEKKINEELNVNFHKNYYFFIRKVLFFIPNLILKIILLLILIRILLLLLRRSNLNDFTIREKKILIKIIVGLFLIVGIYSLKELFSLKNKAIILNPQTSVYSGPDETFQSFEKLPMGTEVTIIKKQGNMYYIRASKFSGWVKSEQLESIVNYE